MADLPTRSESIKPLARRESQPLISVASSMDLDQVSGHETFAHFCNW